MKDTAQSWGWHMDTNALASRAPIEALADVEQFITTAGRLKAIVVHLAERRARESSYQHALVRQINSMTKVCEQLAADSPRVREMWRQAQADFAPLLEQP
jgi:hypothetical protein